MAIVIADPCSMRGRDAHLEPAVLTAAVEPSGKIGKTAWPRGHFGLMPLPDLIESDGLCVARLDDVGKAATQELLASARIACLSSKGINLLQQRIIWRLTRFAVPTHQLQEVSAHVFAEADLLEEWSYELCAVSVALQEATALFESFIRADCGGGRRLQDDLRDPQLRAAVRVACRAEAKRLSKTRL